MSRHPGLYQFTQEVTSHFPHLSKPMAAVLALWAFGMVLARSCGQTRVAAALAPLLGQKDNTVRERLRDWSRSAPEKTRAKHGGKRAELDVHTCWAPWLRWVLNDWSGRQLAVALDATTLGQRFTVLVLSVLYRGCAVPVAWKVLPAREPHPWAPEWRALLQQFRSVLPADWTVIALADRGLYAKWLFEAILALGWHPLLRINTRGTFRPEGWKRRVPLSELVPTVGRRWQGRGEAFQAAPQRLRCTLLACWEPGYTDPWLVLTDLPPCAASACWYGLRAWIEQGFKRVKRGGWQWQGTRMTDPLRAERLWLALALATWWCLSVGGEAEAELQVETLPELPGEPRSSAPGSARRERGRWRLVGVFLRGQSLILAALLLWQPLPWGQGRPEPWPEMPTPQEQHEPTSPESIKDKTLPV
jgi:hypothetical protein